MYRGRRRDDDESVGMDGVVRPIARARENSGEKAGASRRAAPSGAALLEWEADPQRLASIPPKGLDIPEDKGLLYGKRQGSKQH
jgi:hypothetical protein